MQLTLYTDYSLRVLVYLGLKGDDLATISEIADHFEISRNHLVKVVHNLSNHHFIQTVRGKGGGMRLARSPELVNIGDVVRHTEANFNVVECFDKSKNSCAITPVCKLKGALHRAVKSFLGVLDEYTLADVLQNKEELTNIIFMPSTGTMSS